MKSDKTSFSFLQEVDWLLYAAKDNVATVLNMEYKLFIKQKLN